jgi:hypothetical protein
MDRRIATLLFALRIRRFVAGRSRRVRLTHIVRDLHGEPRDALTFEVPASGGGAEAGDIARSGRRFTCRCDRSLGRRRGSHGSMRQLIARSVLHGPALRSLLGVDR